MNGGHDEQGERQGGRGRSDTGTEGEGGEPGPGQGKGSGRGLDALECCPPLTREQVCDTLDFRYVLPWRGTQARVDLILHFRLERCSGPTALGDLAYTTTLLPGEEVRLFTSDRHSRWSYDSSDELAYRHETTSEESYFTYGMARSMSDLNVSESGSVSSSYEEDWSSGGGGASVNFLGLVKIGGGGSAGSFDAESTTEFARNLSRHAESSSSYVAAGVRASSSTSIGEVARRQHAEGESETHLESSTRSFRNPNRCHAITYLFHKIVKRQTVRFRLVAIQRVLADPAAPTTPDRRIVPNLTGKVAVTPQAVRATSKDRLEVERTARQAAVEREQAAVGGVNVAGLSAFSFRAGVTQADPVPSNVRDASLKAVDAELVRADLIDDNGRPTERIVAELSWERTEWLPTPGVLVKGCLDRCNTCEPALRTRIELELEHQRLSNRLLERQIELLEQSQEYRCCPGDAADAEEPEG